MVENKKVIVIPEEGLVYCENCNKFIVEPYAAFMTAVQVCCKWDTKKKEYIAESVSISDPHDGSAHELHVFCPECGEEIDDFSGGYFEFPDDRRLLKED